jgi:hypothetical protein
MSLSLLVCHRGGFKPGDSANRRERPEGNPTMGNQAVSLASLEDERGNRGNTTGKGFSWARPPASRSDA